MQNILSLIDFKKQLEERERVALLMFNSENESSRIAFRSISEATYLNDKAPVFVVDVNEVIDIQSNYQIVEIPSLLFFMKRALVEIVDASQESEIEKALISHELAGK
jgi:hypothetical protein